MSSPSPSKNINEYSTLQGLVLSQQYYIRVLEEEKADGMKRALIVFVPTINGILCDCTQLEYYTCPEALMECNYGDYTVLNLLSQMSWIKILSSDLLANDVIHAQRFQGELINLEMSMRRQTKEGIPSIPKNEEIITQIHKLDNIKGPLKFSRIFIVC